MTAAGDSSSTLLEKLRSARQSGIYRFSLWLLPVVIALFSALAILGFPSLYPQTSGQSLSFRSLPLEAGHAGPSQALASLQTMPQQLSTLFSNGAWFSIDLSPQTHRQSSAIDFPARGVQAITCWRRDTLETIGSLDGRTATGNMRASRSGSALMLEQNDTQTGASFDGLLCQARYAEPTTFTAERWSIPDLRAASDRFHRSIALLDGGILTLALFLTIIALRNREWTFLLLAVWLIGNLRLGAYALGWDSQWLGHALPPDWQPMLRKLTLAAYYLVTCTLFAKLFRKRSGCHPLLLASLQWLGLAQLVAAFVLPWTLFNDLSWAVWGAALAAGLYLLVTRVGQQIELLFSWRFLALTAALTVIVAGLILTLIGNDQLLDSFFAVIALLLSCIVVAMVAGSTIREGKEERLRAQTGLVASYAIAPLGLFALDRKDRFLRMNPILYDMLGLERQLPPPPGTNADTSNSEEHAPTRKGSNTLLHWEDFFTPQNWRKVAALTLEGQETEIHLAGHHSHDGQPRHFALRAALADNGIEGSLQDITARTLAMKELRKLVDNDPLTMALNRNGIEKKLDAALKQLQLNNVPCSLAYMDLDHFKRINGLFGHTSGDEILRQVTERVRSILTGQQDIGRIGSDEFVILFPNSNASDARGRAERIIDDLNGNAYQVGQRFFHIRSAIGVVEVNAEMDASEAISAATRACRDARKQHQDVIVYEHDSSELQAHTEELRLFDLLEGGASPKGLYLEMQPIMSLSAPNESLNFEILLRVRDSHGQLLPTGKIISGAEENGTVTIIDKWVFSATLEWLSKHDERLPKTSFVNVNLSGVSLNDDKFIDNLFQLLGRHPKLTHRLCVEITEGVALHNLERTQKLISRLRGMGVRIALDDFGAGYTSFSYLRQLGADALKIDGTLIRDMLASDTNIAIVRTIVDLAQNLGIISIAEWVEDVKTLETLRELGVDYVQGFVVSPALTPMEILDATSLSDLVSNVDTLAFIRQHSPQPNAGA